MENNEKRNWQFPAETQHYYKSGDRVITNPQTITEKFSS
jgi:hypothetical protein